MTSYLINAYRHESKEVWISDGDKTASMVVNLRSNFIVNDEYVSFLFWPDNPYLIIPVK